MIILLTGATGFLGKIIHSQYINEIDIVKTMSRKEADIIVDLENEVPILPLSDIVIHCAGKAHSIPKTTIEKQAFFDVNLQGTNNLLKGLEGAAKLPNSFVFISTVAVYGCETGTLINESNPLKANDPYGQSKIQAEDLVLKWCCKHNVRCSILRLPLIIGENPPGNLGAMIKGIDKGYYFNIGGGKAKKSMVLAKNVAEIIPIVSKIGGIYNLTDGHHPSFNELSLCISKKLRKRKPLNMPLFLAKAIALAGDLLGDKIPINTDKLTKITSDLTFDDSLAKKMLGWKPEAVLSNIQITK